jgi:hypothetical protein
MRFGRSSRLNEMASFDQSRKEGGTFSAARTSCRSRLRWRLDMSTVGPPKMRKPFSTAWKPPASPSPPSFLASPSFAAARL